MWVVDGSVFSDQGFHAEKYAFIKKNPGGGVTVHIRGHTKVIPKAEGRQFLFSEEEMIAHARKQIERKRHSFVHRAREAAEWLALSDKALLQRKIVFTPPIPPPPIKGKLIL